MKYFHSLICTFYMLMAVVQVEVQAQQSSIGTPLEKHRSTVENEHRSSVLDILSLPAEDDAQIEIYSASKRAENWLVSPNSSSVLTGEEIEKAGCTTIPEALRLVPGVIVRETTNGNFTVHIRGMDNVPPNSYFPYFVGTAALVMIDNRPVYNYQNGGIIWEALPIDLHDIARIEVVRGALSTLFGPNAAMGVINIITKKIGRAGATAQANALLGNQNTRTINASMGYRFNNKLAVRMSFNDQRRERHSDLYYELVKREYVPFESLRYVTDVDHDHHHDHDHDDHEDEEHGHDEEPRDENTSSYFPGKEAFPQDADFAMERFGVNFFVDYAPTQQIDFNIALGLQESFAQKLFGENYVTTLHPSLHESKYIALNGKVHGFQIQANHLFGEQLVSFISQQKFDNTDILVGYSKSFGNLLLTGEANYRGGIFKEQYAIAEEEHEHDDEYHEEEVAAVNFNTRTSLQNFALAARAQYDFPSSLRLKAGVRADKYSDLKDNYLSYHIGANFNINKKHFFRAVHSKAYRAPFIQNVYTDIEIPIFLDELNAVVNQHFTSNQDAKLLSNTYFELGYRLSLDKQTHIELELFQNCLRNFNDVITQAAHAPSFDPITSLTTLHIDRMYDNLPVSAQQIGATIGANFIYSKGSIKPFITYSKTRLLDYSPFYNLASSAPEEGNPDPPNQNITTVSDFDHEGTPDFYGGAYLQYQPIPKFYINLNGYFFTAHTLYHRYNIEHGHDNVGVFPVSTKILLNTKISWQPSTQFSIYLIGKNLLGNHSPESFGTDPIGRGFIGGANLSF